MRIIYNLNCIRAPMTGVAYYTLNMVLGMIQNHPNLEVFAFRNNQLLNKKQILALFAETNSLSKKNSVWKNHLIEIINHSFFARKTIQIQKNLRHQLTLKNNLRNTIYHEPNFVFLPHAGPKVLTVHDTSMFDCPEFLPKGRARFLQQQMRRSMQAADALIASCQFIKNQVLRLIDIDAKKIHIIAPGAQENFKPRDEHEVRASLEKFSLNYKNFLLCVATLEPRKNLVRLITAYKQLPQELQKQYPLVLVGNKGWMYEELLSLTQNTSSNILLLRYIDEALLFDLYSSAKAFVYPSLYEGFGLPVLEAMQSGLPVITSNVTSLPEVCGDAGILVDPLDERAITNAIENLLTNENICNEQKEKSLARAKDFSWKNFSKQLIEVYQKIN